MYYDTYRGKKPSRRRRRERRSCTGWLAASLMKLLAFVLVLVLLAAGVLYALPVALMNIETGSADLALTDNLPGSRVNILLLGLDYMNEGQQRSDAMMVASIGYDGMRLSSLMRDTMVDIPGHGRGKLNSAYAAGGPEMAMRCVNQAFGLNITNYAVVDLKTLVDLVDAVGGVEVNVEADEIEHLNHNAWDTYKMISRESPARYEHYLSSQPVTRTGEMTLDGLFATAYARIRKPDSDYMRAARQREVLTGIIRKLKENLYRPRVYVNLWNVYRNSIRTNLALPELVSLAEKVLIAGEIETSRFPMNEHVVDSGSAIEITKPIENIRAVHEFIYN